MRTLVVSDLHLGNDEGLDIFAGQDSLPALLDRYSDAPTRVVLNGDTVDFLMNEDPLEMRLELALRQAEALVQSNTARPIFEALGRIVTAGGHVFVRLGNHDLELSLPDVQGVMMDAMGVPRRQAVSHTTFRVSDAAELYAVGGARVLVEHGDRHDVMNRVDHKRLKRAHKLHDYSEFVYPPGSQLVKLVLNPLKLRERMRFVDLLKPNFQGAALAAMSVNAMAVKELIQEHGMSLGWQLFKNAGDGPMYYSSSQPEPRLGLAEAMDEVELDEDELSALEDLFADEDALFFAAEDEQTRGRRRRALLKLGRSGLSGIARRARGGGQIAERIAERGFGTVTAAQKALTASDGAGLETLSPGPEEWALARQLAEEQGAHAVVQGHTHVARWKLEDGVGFINTGTWTELMELPDADADDSVWQGFLRMLKANPGLDPDHEAPPVQHRFTAALFEPTSEGALARLIRVDPTGDIETLAEGPIGG